MCRTGPSIQHGTRITTVPGKRPWKEALEKRFPKFLAQDLPAMIFWTAPRGPAVLNQYRERRG